MLKQKFFALQGIIFATLLFYSSVSYGGATKPATGNLNPPSTDTYDIEEFIYGHSEGAALSAYVLTPKNRIVRNALDKAVLFMSSGGWASGHDATANFGGMFDPFLKRGQIVFVVIHRSQPRYQIPHAVDDARRAVRFIRYNAGRFQIDPNRIGTWGISSGGHLAAMLGGNLSSKDVETYVTADPPIPNNISVQAQCVVNVVGPTDFTNWDAQGKIQTGTGALDFVSAAFDFEGWDDRKKKFMPMEDKNSDMYKWILISVSPIYAVNPNFAQTLLLTAERDELVPTFQHDQFYEALKSAGVRVERIIKHGVGHGLDEEFWYKDIDKIADWFSRCLG